MTMEERFKMIGLMYDCLMIGLTVYVAVSRKGHTKPF